MGHSKGVHDIDFDNSGAQFMSAAYDRQMKLWDTETGTFALPLALYSPLATNLLIFALHTAPQASASRLSRTARSRIASGSILISRRRSLPACRTRRSLRCVSLSRVFGQVSASRRLTGQRDPCYCTVRHAVRRDHARVRPAFGTGQHDHLCRREPAVHHHFGRQDDARVGL